MRLSAEPWTKDSFNTAYWFMRALLRLGVISLSGYCELTDAIDEVTRRDYRQDPWIE